MMSTASAWCLSKQQCCQLMTHLTIYRSYLWQAVLPTPERNQVIRLIQALQGRLASFQEKAPDICPLPLSGEEGAMLKSVLGEIIKLYGTYQVCEQRNQAIQEVTGLRLLLQQTLRKTQAL